MKKEKTRGEPKGQPRKRKAVSPPPAIIARKDGGVAGFTKPAYVIPSHPAHRGEPVRVGNFEVFLGGTRDLTSSDLEKADILIPLLGSLPPLSFGKEYRILAAPLVDYGGVPTGWEDFLRNQVVPLLEAGQRVLAFCMGSHGRTGTFLASLIALLESPAETPDPIAAARERHCYKAVESRSQAEAVFALRGEKLPAKYESEFVPRAPLGLYGGGIGGRSFGPQNNWKGASGLDDRWY